MKHWIRLAVSRHCGGCCQSIPKDAPALVITTELGAKFLRCQACATQVHGETPPDVIEAPLSPSYVLPAFSATRPIRDSKQRQTGEQE